jgi:hypothetical protein
MMWVRKFSIGVALAMLVSGMEGCGSKGPAVGSVEGQVTFDQQPVTEGNVVFENAERGLAYVARLEAEGRYRLADVKLAEYKVCVKPPEAKIPDETSGNPVGVIVTPQGAIPNPTNVPRDFRAMQSTPLKATVVEGPNRFNYDLAHP